MEDRVDLLLMQPVGFAPVLDLLLDEMGVGLMCVRVVARRALPLVAFPHLLFAFVHRIRSHSFIALAFRILIRFDRP